jgi:hypothetical protein
LYSKRLQNRTGVILKAVSNVIWNITADLNLKNVNLISGDNDKQDGYFATSTFPNFHRRTKDKQ